MWTPKGESAAAAGDTQSLNQIRSLNLLFLGREAGEILSSQIRSFLAGDICMQERNVTISTQLGKDSSY